LLSESSARDIIVALDASAANGSGSEAFARGGLLAAQRNAVRSMLNALAPRLGQVRVGLLSHAADTARIEIPLTDDLGALYTALDAIRVRGSNTDPSYSAALALATTAFENRDEPPDSTRGTREKVTYLLFDAGSPFDAAGGRAVDGSNARRSARNWARTVETAHNAVRAGVELHVLALRRPRSGSAPGDSREAASATLPSSWPALYAIPGSYTPIEAPAASADWLEHVSLARVTQVRIDNLTTREAAIDVALFPSGAFAAEVRVDTGRNQLRITALSSDGRTGQIDVDLDFRPPTVADRALQAERERMHRVRAARHKSLEMNIEVP